MKSAFIVLGEVAEIEAQQRCLFRFPFYPRRRPFFNPQLDDREEHSERRRLYGLESTSKHYYVEAAPAASGQCTFARIGALLYPLGAEE